MAVIDCAFDQGPALDIHLVRVAFDLYPSPAL